MALSQRVKNRLYEKYGKWAVVTGASSGIGRELAERLAEAGLNLVLNARRESLLQTFAQELQQAYGTTTRIIAADLSTQQGMDTLLQGVQDLDVGLLVATAGFGTSGSFLESDLANEINMLEVNCNASMQLTHHFGQRFAQRGRGGIILMGSIVGFQGVPYAAHYAATKAYIQSFAEALALELKPHGVDVLSAAPGPVVSGFAERADMQLGAALKPEDVGVPILKALGRKSTVLPGTLTKFLVGSLRTLPRWGKIRVMRLIMGGMTKHQRA